MSLLCGRLSDIQRQSLIQRLPHDSRALQHIARLDSQDISSKTSRHLKADWNILALLLQVSFSIRSSGYHICLYRLVYCKGFSQSKVRHLTQAAAAGAALCASDSSHQLEHLQSLFLTTKMLVSSMVLLIQYTFPTRLSSPFLLRPGIPLSPGLDPTINLLSRDPILDQLHHDPQLLDISIPTLIIEKQHLLILHPTLALQSLEVRGLRARIYLHMIEETDCRPSLASFALRFGGDAEEGEHGACEIWCGSSRCGAEDDALFFDVVKDRRYVVVETAGLSISILHGQASVFRGFERA